MRDNADDVARDGIDDGQTMDLVFGQYTDRIEKAVFGLEINEGTIVLFENLSPGLNLVLFQLLYLGLNNQIGSDYFLITFPNCLNLIEIDSRLADGSTSGESI